MPTQAFMYCHIFLTYFIKKALLTTTLQNSSTVCLYEEKGNVYVKSLPKHTDSDLHWCCPLKSKFTSTTSNGKLGTICRRVPAKTMTSSVQNRLWSTLQENQWCYTALPSTTGDHGFNWGEGLPLICRAPDDTEGGVREVCFCSVPVQWLSILYQGCCSPWHQAERSSLLPTALARTPVRTTQQGLALRRRLQGDRGAALGPAVWRTPSLQLLKEKAGATREPLTRWTILQENSLRDGRFTHADRLWEGFFFFFFLKIALILVPGV